MIWREAFNTWGSWSSSTWKISNDHDSMPCRDLCSPSGSWKEASRPVFSCLNAHVESKTYITPKNNSARRSILGRGYIEVSLLHVSATEHVHSFSFDRTKPWDFYFPQSASINLQRRHGEQVFELSETSIALAPGEIFFSLDKWRWLFCIFLQCSTSVDLLE